MSAMTPEDAQKLIGCLVEVYKGKHGRYVAMLQRLGEPGVSRYKNEKGKEFVTQRKNPRAIVVVRGVLEPALLYDAGSDATDPRQRKGYRPGDQIDVPVTIIAQATSQGSDYKTALLQSIEKWNRIVIDKSATPEMRAAARERHEIDAIALRKEIKREKRGYWDYMLERPAKLPPALQLPSRAPVRRPMLLYARF